MFIHLFLYIDDMVFLADVRLRSGLPKFYNGKLVQTLLEGRFILSLEGTLSRDCDVEKNGKWSCIYVVGSQEYQMVYTRLDIASADVGILDNDVYDTYWAWKKEIWLKGLLAELGYELSLVAGIATGALVKGGSRSEVPAQELLQEHTPADYV
ncbi:hypothetical protein Tco_1233965 [Tanacetum coccineum]